MDTPRPRGLDHHHPEFPGTPDLRVTDDINDPQWHRLRSEFTGESDPSEQSRFLREFSANSVAFVAFIACDPQANPVGFCEVSIRREYVNGCQHRPVLYLEGIYVKSTMRRQGIARALCDAAAEWGIDRGCREFASDVDIDNEPSRKAHQALGFVEVGRVVCLKQNLHRH